MDKNQPIIFKFLTGKNKFNNVKKKTLPVIRDWDKH